MQQAHKNPQPTASRTCKITVQSANKDSCLAPGKGGTGGGLSGTFGGSRGRGEPKMASREFGFLEGLLVS